MDATKTCCFTGHRRIPADDLPAVAAALRREVLRLCREEGITVFLSGGALGFDTLAAETVLRDFAAEVRRRLHANGVRYADADRPVKVVACGGGSCGDYAAAAKAAGADTLVTGEASYHDMRDALLLGVNLIAAGHFPTEDPVCGVLIKLIRERFPALEVKKSEVLGDAWHVIGEMRE